MDGLPLTLPFHLLLSAELSDPGQLDAQRAPIAAERRRVLGMVEDLLHAAVAQLDGLRQR